MLLRLQLEKHMPAAAIKSWQSHLRQICLLQPAGSEKSDAPFQNTCLCLWNIALLSLTLE